MVDVVYKERIFQNTCSTALDNKKHMKVSTCPYCNISTDATRVGIKHFSIKNGIIADVTYRCTSCDKVFHVSYVKLNDDNMFNPYSVYPNFQGREFSDEIKNISPRFVKLFNQAYKAEYDNNLELAGC